MDFLNRLQTDELSDNAFLQELCSLVSDSLTVEDAGRIEHAKSTTDFLMSKINFFVKSEGHSNTAKLWLQYLKMVEICLLFLKAEGTGN